MLSQDYFYQKLQTNWHISLPDQICIY